MNFFRKNLPPTPLSATKDLPPGVVQWLRQVWEVVNAFQAPPYLVSGLPSAADQPQPTDGLVAYATDGRKPGEGAGAGTGVLCYFSNGHWRRTSDDAVVTA